MDGKVIPFRFALWINSVQELRKRNAAAADFGPRESSDGTLSTWIHTHCLISTLFRRLGKSESSPKTHVEVLYPVLFISDIPSWPVSCRSFFMEI
jgi:hypothetical protein